MEHIFFIDDNYGSKETSWGQRLLPYKINIVWRHLLFIIQL